MTTENILILGGYGTTGALLAELLLAETEVSITLAGRNLEKAERAAYKLNEKFKTSRAAGSCVNASDSQSLLKGFKGMDLVIIASSTSQYTQKIAGAAIEAGADYFDMQYSTEKIQVLRSMASDIETSERCFITDGGFHPGLPAAMVRWAAENYVEIISANIGSMIKIDWGSLNLSPETMQEFVGEFMSFNPRYYRDGRWHKASALAMMVPKFMDFGDEFGRQYCIPMFLEELRPLPEEFPSLHETGFFVGGFNWFVDWLLTPVLLLGLKLFPRKGLEPMGRLMYWGLKTFSHPPFGTRLQMEAVGRQADKLSSMTMIISHPDGYVLTAIPAAACIKQYLQGDIRKPGLWLQAHIVKPNQFFRDMQHMGAEIKINGMSHV